MAPIAEAAVVVIFAHFTIELTRHCLVQQMLMRRNANERYIHRLWW